MNGLLESCTAIRPLYATVPWGHPRTNYLELIGTPGQHGSPPRSWWCPVVGMYRLEPNWWVQSGAGECKGSRPALPIHHTTVVLRCSYPAAVHRPSTGVYIYLGGHHWTWGYNHSSVLVNKVGKHLYNLTLPHARIVQGIEH